MEEKTKKITVRDVLIHTRLATSNQDIQNSQRVGEIAITDDRGRTQYAVNQFDDASWATRIKVGDQQCEFSLQEVLDTRERNKSANLIASKEAAITPPDVGLDSDRRYVDGLHREQLRVFKEAMERRSITPVRYLMQNDKIEGRVVGTVELAATFKAETAHGIRDLKDARQYTLIEHQDQSYTIAPTTAELRRAEHHTVRIDASRDPIEVDNLTIRATIKEAMFRAEIERGLPKFRSPDKKKGPITR